MEQKTVLNTEQLSGQPSNSIFSGARIFLFSLYAFIFIIPISQNYSKWLLAVSVIFSLVLVQNRAWRKNILHDGWDLLVYFGVLAFGLGYTTDLDTGFGVLEKNLSFLMIPLLASRLADLDKSMLIRMCVIFTSGVVVAGAICLGFAIYRDVALDFPGGYFYDEFTTVIDLQPTYLAYYVCFSIIFLLYLISYETTTRMQRVGIAAGILLLSAMLMLTAGRSTFMSLLLMSSFFFQKLMMEPYPMKRKLQGISLTALLFILILFQSPYAGRLFPGFYNERSGAEKRKGDTWERITLWESALKASPNIIAGVGTGDHTQVMNSYFRKHDLPEFAEGNFNSHNQYIQVLFSNGIPGLLMILVILLRPIALSMRRQNIFGMLTFFPFLIYGISEVFLGRYQGIVFFILLHQIFVRYLNTNPEKSLIRKPEGLM